MLATTPPTEQPMTLRAAILALARQKVEQLACTPADVEALPAWLWSLPAHEIARSLILDPHMFVREVAAKLEAETARRHPAEKYVTYLATRHRHLSHVQRARLAEFAYLLDNVMKGQNGPVMQDQMVRRGFTIRECEAYAVPAARLLAAFDKAEHESAPPDRRNSLDNLRDAGERAHARRALAEGDLEFDAAAAAAGRLPNTPATVEAAS